MLNKQTPRSEMRGNDWNQNHFTFQRRTGLPRDYFTPPRPWASVLWIVACVACLAFVVAAVLCGVK